MQPQVLDIALLSAAILALPIAVWGGVVSVWLRVTRSDRSPRGPDASAALALLLILLAAGWWDVRFLIHEWSTSRELLWLGYEVTALVLVVGLSLLAARTVLRVRTPY